MSIRRFFTHPLTIIAFPGEATGPYNGDESWAGAAETLVLGWFPQTEAVEEDTGDRDATVTYQLVSWPAGTVIGARDRVRDEATGSVYKVTGEPNLCPRPNGVSHHVEVKLSRVSG